MVGVCPRMILWPDIAALEDTNFEWHNWAQTEWQGDIFILKRPGGTGSMRML